MSYYMVPSGSRRFRHYQPVRFNGGRRLPVDVHVDSEEYVITAAVPGLLAEDLKIEILDDVVTLSGEVASEENDEERVLLNELSHGSFTRSLRMPDPLDAENAEAQIENGVLTVRIPKSEEAKPKTIEVKAG
jgi:HSP20 family protein